MNAQLESSVWATPQQLIEAVMKRVEYGQNFVAENGLLQREREMGTERWGIQAQRRLCRAGLGMMNLMEMCEMGRYALSPPDFSSCFKTEIQVPTMGEVRLRDLTPA